MAGLVFSVHVHGAGARWNHDRAVRFTRLVDRCETPNDLRQFFDDLRFSGLFGMDNFVSVFDDQVGQLCVYGFRRGFGGEFGLCLDFCEVELSF